MKYYGRKTINRIGEEGYNNFGSEMVIVKYNNADDIDVYFPEYNWTAKNAQYDNFKKGNIVCPYEKRVYNVGYIGEGKYKAKENGKLTKCYDIWYAMLRRCYDPKFHEKEPTYKDCEVCKEWLNHQNFGDWFEDNYYEIESERICLDKDILHKGNKIYSPDNCIFVPHNINSLFIKRDNYRGNYPIGVSYKKQNKKFQVKCSVYDSKTNKSKRRYLVLYATPEKAFRAYKQCKEQNIKEVADYYKCKIPEKLYNALYKYKVEIND